MEVKGKIVSNKFLEKIRLVSFQRQNKICLWNWSNSLIKNFSFWSESLGKIEKEWKDWLCKWVEEGEK